MLLQKKNRIVIEIDGKQHYTKDFNSKIASSEKYAEMVNEDWILKLNCY